MEDESGSTRLMFSTEPSQSKLISRWGTRTNSSGNFLLVPIKFVVVPFWQHFDELVRVKWEFGNIHAWLSRSFGFRAGIFDARERKGAGLARVRVLQHPQLMASLHDIEHALCGEHRQHFSTLFARIGVEIEECRSRQTGFFPNPDTLVATFDSSGQDVARVNENVISSAESVPLQEQCGLIYTVDNPVGRDVVCCPS